MYQHNLFSNMAEKHGEYLGSGLFSTVWAMTNGTVCKVGNNDGTRNWLELCALHTAAGTLMPMMPEVFQLVALEDDKYMAFMPKYDSMAEFNVHYIFSDMLYKDAKEVFKDYLELRNGGPVGEWLVFNDVHSGNVMNCPKRGTVITDPSCSDYMLQTPEVPFVLN